MAPPCDPCNYPCVTQPLVGRTLGGFLATIFSGAVFLRTAGLILESGSEFFPLRIYQVLAVSSHMVRNRWLSSTEAMVEGGGRVADTLPRIPLEMWVGPLGGKIPQPSPW